MNFGFATATQILFGPGTLKQVGPLVAPLGRRAFIVTGRNQDRAAGLIDLLEADGITTRLFPVASEPTVDLVMAGVMEARDFGSEVVIGFGGGSAIDAAKAIAALLTNEGDPLDYLEVVGRGLPIQKRPAPLVAIPTTAGTGAEVTRNAVLGVPEQGRKVSMRHAMMLADLAIVDPELTHSLPPAITAQAGLDALTQCIEPFLSHQANPLTDGLCREGIRRAARSLRTAFREGENAAAREDMALTSLFGGLALANAKLGAVHGFAGPMGGELEAAHGTICGRLLPYTVEANWQALREREPNSAALPRLDELGTILTGHPKANAADAIEWLHALCRDLSTEPLSRLGLTPDAIPEMARKAQASSSMKGNPIELTLSDLEGILHAAL